MDALTSLALSALGLSGNQATGALECLSPFVLDTIASCGLTSSADAVAAVGIDPNGGVVEVDLWNANATALLLCACNATTGLAVLDSGVGNCSAAFPSVANLQKHLDGACSRVEASPTCLAATRTLDEELFGEPSNHDHHDETPSGPMRRQGDSAQGSITYTERICSNVTAITTFLDACTDLSSYDTQVVSLCQKVASSDVLNAAATTGTSLSNSNYLAATSPSNHAAVYGGIFGPLAAVGLLVAGFVYHRRRTRKQRSDAAIALASLNIYNGDGYLAADGDLTAVLLAEEEEEEEKGKKKLAAEI
ncbi:hypothetical protein BC830DRAFT_1159663 [Chytriomyces sp. MP71]|nr:hypothetical protein BC830DRAFT_1159663 [Chytriomyces sp. MP71]